MAASNNKVNITSLVARKAATQYANRLFHAPVGIASTFHPLGLYPNGHTPEVTTLPPQDEEDSIAPQQKCPIYQIIPSPQSNIKCINCDNTVSWDALTTSSLMMHTAKPSLVAVCSSCA